MDFQNDTWSTSPSLIRRAQAQEENAWLRLCEVYSPLVYGWVRKAGAQECDAADIVQEVFSAVFSAMDRFCHEQPNATFRGWLLTITRNKIRDWHRKREKQVVKAEGGTDAQDRIVHLAAWVNDDDESQALVDDPSSELELIRRAAEIVRHDFQPKTWQAFWQTTVEGRPAGEVAAELELTTNAIRQARFRVLTRLREVLG